MARKFVLSVDGGGIRCIIAALILVDLERRIRESGRRAPLNRYFHLLAGSGAGAIILSALAFQSFVNPNESVSGPADIVKFFHNTDLLFATRIKSASGQMIHDTEGFETFLKQWFGEKRLISEASTHVLFPAFDLARRAPAIFSDLDPATSQFYLWQALRATTASPRYMAPALVENRADRRQRGTPLIPFVGIGRYADDPALAAYVQARKLGWNEGDGVTMLSIGSGVDARPIPFFSAHGNHGLNMTDVTLPLITSADELYNPIANNVNQLMNNDPRAFTGVKTKMTSDNRERLSYFRINGALEKASMAVDDYCPENIRLLHDEAARIIVENSALLDEIVRRLPSPAGISVEQPARGAPIRIGKPENKVMAIQCIEPWF